MITTGFPTEASRKTEVIDLNEDGKRCADMADFPIGISGASGCIIDSEILICGGWKFSRPQGQCYKLDENQWIKSAKLKTRAYNHAGVVLNNDRLWLTAGNG